MRLPDLIRAKREALHWTRAELARQAGLSEPVIGKIEEGRSGGRASTVFRITRALGIDPAAVMDEVVGTNGRRAVYQVDLSDIPEEYRADVERAIEGLVAPFRRSVNHKAPGDPPPDSQRLGAVAVAHKAPSHMAVA